MIALTSLRTLMANVPWTAIFATSCLILLMAIAFESYRIGKLQGQIAVASEEAKVNATVVAEERRLRARSDELSFELAKRQRKRQQDSFALSRRIDNAPASIDGPIAPVLRAALDRLHADPDPARADTNRSAARPAQLQ